MTFASAREVRLTGVSRSASRERDGIALYLADMVPGLRPPGNVRL